MTLRLYDTAARAVRDFVPAEPGKASIYLCGATVQAPPHIGHIRSGVNFDILRRWLEHRGDVVTFVRNVTDIDDKILRRGEDEGVPYWVVAQRNENAFAWAYDVLGCLRPTVEPRATGHVPEMITLIQRLIDAGHAYAAAGDVYFSVGSFAEYGALSGQKPDAMQAAGDTDVETDKRDVRDFALWKSAKAGEPFWDTPWGPGRPGWHLECSAMAGKYLGDRFDIHGGGLDLVFPHHENEIAQSKAAGESFAEYWLHNAWVTLSGEKMSKSLGNSLLVSEIVKRVRPVELRYFLAAPHYRSMVEYSDASLVEAATAFARIETFLRNATELVGEVTPGAASDASERGTSEERERATSTASDASERGTSEERERATSTASDASERGTSEERERATSTASDASERGTSEERERAGSTVPAAFAEAMDDDLGTPLAFAAVHSAVREGNTALAAGDKDTVSVRLAEARAMLGVLGLDPLAEPWADAAGSNEDLRTAVDRLVALALEQRAAARERKDYAAADAVRDRLRGAGVVIEDTPNGPRWTVGSPTDAPSLNNASGDTS